MTENGLNGEQNNSSHSLSNLQLEIIQDDGRDSILLQKEVSKMIEGLKGIVKFEQLKIKKFIGCGSYGACFLVIGPVVMNGRTQSRNLVAKFVFKPTKDSFSVQECKDFIMKDCPMIPFHKNVASVAHLKISMKKEDVYCLKNAEGVLPNCNIIDREFIDGQVLLMKYYETNLQKYLDQRKLKNSPLSRNEICYIMMGLLEGGNHLHNHKIVHRDLHLGNIFIVFREGYTRVIIGDFGSSLNLKKCVDFKIRRDETSAEFPTFLYSFSHSSKMFRKGGYLTYLPPEIAKFDPQTQTVIDYEKSDIFSIGMIGKELLKYTSGSKNDLDKSKDMLLRKLFEMMTLEDIPSRFNYGEALRELSGIAKLFENVDWKSHFTESEEKRRGMEEEIRLLRIVAEDGKQSYERIIVEKTEYLRRIENLSDSLEQRNDEVHTLIGSLTDLKKELSVSESRVAEKKGEMEKLEEECKTIDRRLQKEVSDVNRLNGELHQANVELKESKSIRRKQEREIKTQVSNFKDAVYQVEKLERTNYLSKLLIYLSFVLGIVFIVTVLFFAWKINVYVKTVSIPGRAELELKQTLCREKMVEDAMMKYYDLCDDEEFIFSAAGLCSYSFKFSSHRLRSDYEFGSRVVSTYENTFSYLDSELQHRLSQDQEKLLEIFALNNENVDFVREYGSAFLEDVDFAITVMKINGMALAFFSKEFQSNQQIVFEAAKNSDHSMKFASEELRNDTTFMSKVFTESGPYALVYASFEIRDNKSIVFPALEKGISRKCLFLEIYESLSERLKADKDIFTLALYHDPMMLEFASDDIKNDKEIVKKVVSMNGMALQFAGEKLKRRFDVSLAAGRSNGMSLQFSQYDARGERDVVRVSQFHELFYPAVENTKGKAFQFAPKILRQDKKFCSIVYDGYPDYRYLIDEGVKVQLREEKRLEEERKRARKTEFELEMAKQQLEYEKREKNGIGVGYGF